MGNNIENDYSRLLEYMGELDGALVCYSGGADSTLVAAAARKALGDNNMIAVMAFSPLLGAGEEKSAYATAMHFRFPMQVIVHPGFSLDAVRDNHSDRCYHCKHALLELMNSMSEDYGFSSVLLGDNADDLRSDRPGKLAAAELGVKSPLAELGFGKESVRAMLKMLGAPNHNAPSSSCLATRFPENCHLSLELLDLVREAECRLTPFGPFEHLRIRCDAKGNARITLSKEDEGHISAEQRNEMLKKLDGLAFSSIEFAES